MSFFFLTLSISFSFLRALSFYLIVHLFMCVVVIISYISFFYLFVHVCHCNHFLYLFLYIILSMCVIVVISYISFSLFPLSICPCVSCVIIPHVRTSSSSIERNFPPSQNHKIDDDVISVIRSEDDVIQVMQS